MSRLLPISQRRRRGQRGSESLEFALASMLLIPLLAGCFQFGYFFYQYGKLRASVGSAARYASQRAYDSATPSVTTAYQDAVRNSVRYGDPAYTSVEPQPGLSDGPPVQVIVPGLRPEHVTVTVAFEDGVPRRVTVGINDYVMDGIFGKVTLRNKPRTTYAYVGRWAAP